MHVYAYVHVSPPTGVQSAPLGAGDGGRLAAGRIARAGVYIIHGLLEEGTAYRMSHDLSSRPLVVGGSAPCFPVCFWACVGVTLYGYRLVPQVGLIGFAFRLNTSLYLYLYRLSPRRDTPYSAAVRVRQPVSSVCRQPASGWRRVLPYP